MAFISAALTSLQAIVKAPGAGLGIWGAINLPEGRRQDNPGAKSRRP